MSSEAPGGRQPPLRAYRRRKALPDLNVPPVETREHEALSTLAAAATQVIDGVSQLPGQPEPPEAIDVEAIDDDVIVTSPRSFAEAKYNAARTRGTAVVVDLDSGCGYERTTRCACNSRNTRRRVPSSQNIITCDYHISVEGIGSFSSQSNNSQPQPPPPPPPPKEPTFKCPICMSPFVEETSTKCGHIFCKACIKSAIAVQAKCPVCRKRAVAKDLTRVFLPSTT